jgi:hypothetical protein
MTQWIIDLRSYVGHALAPGAGHVTALCGKGRAGWRSAKFVETRPRIVCEDCRRALDGEAPRAPIGADPAQEWQRRLF